MRAEPVESLRTEIDVVEPYDGAALLSFLGRRCIAGVEAYGAVDDVPHYARTVRLAHGPGVIDLAWTGASLLARSWTAAADRSEALAMIRRLCDARADAPVIANRLAADPAMASLVAAHPGLRVPGAVDPDELACRALIGQQVSLAAAAVCAARLAVRYGEPVTPADPRLHRLHRLMPTAAALASADPAELPMPRARGRALVGLARALADGTLDLHGDQPWPERRAALLATPGIGPWTADYIAMRGLADPDILLGTDLVIKRELALRQITDTTRWSPWRSYATMHLWHGFFDRG